MVQTSLIARLYHWHPTKPAGLGSDAEHRTLGELYDYLSEQVDEVVEAYQGDKGLLTLEIPATGYDIEPVKAIELLCEELKKCDCEDWCKNKLQEIEFALYKFKYKLEILK